MQPTMQPIWNTGMNPPGLGMNSLLAPLPPVPPPDAMTGSGATPVGATSAPVPPISDIPPPHLIAPWVFSPPRPQTPIVLPPNYNNQQYNNQQVVNQPWLPQQPLPNQQPPMPPAPQPPVDQQVPPPAPKPEPSQTPTAQLSDGLNDATIRQLNERLNSGMEGVRADAAVDFFKILKKSPGLATDPVYKPYVDAFMEKILTDPSAVVRQPALLAMEMNLVPDPAAGVVTQLQTLSNKGGLLSIESDAAKAILANLKQPKPLAAQKVDVLSQGTPPVVAPVPKVSQPPVQAPVAQPFDLLSQSQPMAPDRLPTEEELMALMNQMQMPGQSPLAQAQPVAGQQLNTVSPANTMTIPPGIVPPPGQRLNHLQTRGAS